MTKRGNGEGSITRRLDGRWLARVSLPNGQRRYLYARTRQEVAQKLNQALRALQDGQPLAPERQTVRQYLETWLETAARPTVRTMTLEGYERMLRIHVIPEVGSIRLARLTPQALSLLYQRLIDKGLSARSVQLTHAIIHRALRQAVRWRLISVSPADAVDAPRPVRREFRVLTLEEVRRLLEAAKGNRLEGLYVVALAGGLRLGEILGLRWQDLSLDAGTLAVRQQAQRVKGGWTFPEPKTGAGRRVVSLPALAVDALRRHRAQQLEERLKVGPAWRDGLDLVFTNIIGGPIEKQNLARRSFAPLLERAGLPHIRFHDLRHSSATLLLAGGIHPRVVQERLGHASIAVTMDIYSHVMPTLQREAAEHLDRALAVR